MRASVRELPTFVQTLYLCHQPVKHLMSTHCAIGYHRAVPTGPGDILELIRHGRATTRGDVLEVTGLSRMTISQRLDALLAAGMIVGGKTPGAAGGGRGGPPGRYTPPLPRARLPPPTPPPPPPRPPPAGA